MPAWRRLDARRVASCGIFDVDAVRFAREGGLAAQEFHVLSAPDWINVIPLTAERRVVLVRQYRFGIAGDTLEIPGGMCDRGETPEQAAWRELREETGYTARALEPLGWVHPNPPLQDNRCHSFLARDASWAGEPQPDAHERFEVLTVPLDELPDLVARGAITHALVLAALHLLDVSGRR